MIQILKIKNMAFILKPILVKRSPTESGCKRGWIISEYSLMKNTVEALMPQPKLVMIYSKLQDIQKQIFFSQKTWLQNWVSGIPIMILSRKAGYPHGFPQHTNSAGIARYRPQLENSFKAPVRNI